MSLNIAFVNDDPYVNDVIQEVLETIGYEVVITRSSNTANEPLESQTDSFDLVITDMNMSLMRGITC